MRDLLKHGFSRQAFFHEMRHLMLQDQSINAADHDDRVERHEQRRHWTAEPESTVQNDQRNREQREPNMRAHPALQCAEPPEHHFFAHAEQRREDENRKRDPAENETERRAANAVHDDVLSVLRTVAITDRPLPWSVLVVKARQAQSALARRVPADRRGSADLGLALRRQATIFTPELDIRWRMDGDLDVPATVAEALSGATGEALRNVAAHAGVREATVSARGDGSGGVEVMVSDNGAGFDPGQVGPVSTGLRNSVRGRLRDVGGSAEVFSSPGRGTTVVLTWRPLP